jgi:hypothetical protein
MKGDGIPLTPASVLYYRVKTYLPDYLAFAAGLLGFRRRPVLLAEFIDAAAGIHNFLLARVERMAIGAHFDLQIMADRRASLELIAAGAGHCDDFIFWMDIGFHRNLDKSNGRIDEPAKGAHRHALIPRSWLGRAAGASNRAEHTIRWTVVVQCPWHRPLRYGR